MQIIVILLTIVVLWTKAFIEPETMRQSELFAPLYNLVYSWVHEYPVIAVVAGLLLTIGEGVWLNIVLYNHKLTSQPTLFPTFFYIVVMGMGETQTLTPTLFVNAMIIGMIQQLLSSGSSTLAPNKIFNASFFIGLAALIYLPALTLVVPMLFLFVTYKLYKWNNIVEGLMGLIAPVIVFAVYCYMTDRLTEYVDQFATDINKIALNWELVETKTMVCQAVEIILLIIMLFNRLIKGDDYLIAQRINLRVLTLPLLAAVLMTLYVQLFPFDIASTAPTYAFLATGFFFTRRRRKWINDAVLWVCIIVTTVGIWL